MYKFYGINIPDKPFKNIKLRMIDSFSITKNFNFNFKPINTDRIIKEKVKINIQIKEIEI